MSTWIRDSKVCIVREHEDAPIDYACHSGRHRHMSRRAVDELVRAGEMRWIGPHKRLACYITYAVWRKRYTRNAAGEALACGMQLVRA